ncbi:hypothetical protein BDF20DRAFT_344418 [Mycotypha africana]|uniref:uncharacterized protein n=1 Tax=Mycotypha africana TaxID=64632 RepID=UPI0023018459|nr:uncharacterized protein BDF20DRAFT_344418 [Mycotypha africana]KAI8988631.1 hypothetical protein BDF20DRAFT_344418 [Mycotypha africana]
MNSTIVDTLNDSYFNFQGCSEKLFVLRSRALQYTNNGTGLTLESNNGPTKKQVLHAQAFSSPSSVTSVGKNKKPTRQVKNSTTDSTMVKNENNGADSDSNGNKLIRRLLPSNNKHDIDKNSEKYAHQRPILVNLPARSNSLSAMSTVTYNKSKVSPTITLSSERRMCCNLSLSKCFNIIVVVRYMCLLIYSYIQLSIRYCL